LVLGATFLAECRGEILDQGGGPILNEPQAGIIY